MCNSLYESAQRLCTAQATLVSLISASILRVKNRLMPTPIHRRNVELIIRSRMIETYASKGKKKISRTKQRPLHWILERTRLLWVYKTSVLSANVLRDICDYLISPAVLIYLKHSKIRCFDMISHEWKSLCKLSADLFSDYFLAYTLTICDADTFVIAGGLRNKFAAHIIEDGNVSALPNLTQGRYAHGAVYICQCNRVYVFGGAMISSINSCESLDLQTRSWQEVASMHERRADIYPLLYGHLVYIVGGDNEGTIETYDWRRDCFAQFSLKMPRTTYFLAVITGNSMLCISKECNYRVDLRTEQVSQIYKHEPFQFNKAMSVVKTTNVVLFANEFSCSSYVLEDGMKISTFEDHD